MNPQINSIVFNNFSGKYHTYIDEVLEVEPHNRSTLCNSYKNLTAFSQNMVWSKSCIFYYSFFMERIVRKFKQFKITYFQAKTKKNISRN